MDAHTNRFLAGFSNPGREKLINSIILENYSDRNFLFHEDDPADGVCMVFNGEVEVFRLVGSREQMLGIFKEDDFLGEAAVLDGLGRSATARARGAVTIGKIPKAALMEVLLLEPAGVMIHIFQQLLVYLRLTNSRFIDELLHKEKLSLLGEMACSLTRQHRPTFCAD